MPVQSKYELSQQINELEISIQNLATESELLSISSEELAGNPKYTTTNTKTNIS